MSLLVEATSVPTATAREGVWRAVLITPGTGASGTYSEEMLKEYGPKAFKAGAKSYVTHNRLPNGEPDPFQMWGFLAEDAHYEDGVGLVSEIEVLPSWRDRIAEVAPHTGLSVSVSGEVDNAGNVTLLEYDAQNGVDLVSHPGRPGSQLIEKLYEAAANDKASATAGNPKEQENSNMEIEDIAKKVDELAESLNAFTATVQPIIESMKPADPEDGDTDAVDAVLSASEKAVEADLPKELRQAVIEAVKADPSADADALIQEKKALVESIKTTLTESGKYVVTETASTTFNPKIEGWGR